MSYFRLARTASLFLVAFAASSSSQNVRAGFVLAGENGFSVDLVAHMMGYDGTGGHVNISIGIDPTSTFATQMQIPVQNVITVWNGLAPTTGNVQTANVPLLSYDFESVLLHEMGHALGLAHPNLASESGVAFGDQDYTKSTAGANNTYDLNAGADGVIGSADDLRGDDVNVNYFNISTNDPFDTNLPAVIDSTTYSRELADLPAGDLFAANASRDVAALLGYGSTESVMQQGQEINEAQRTLAAEDVAHIRYAMSGLDELQGTSDDYTFTLQYSGLTTAADIVLDFDDAEAFGFAATTFDLTPELATNHVAISEAAIYFDDLSDFPFGINWFFNDVLLEQQEIPEVPGSVLLLFCGVFGAGASSLRRARRTASCSDTAA